MSAAIAYHFEKNSMGWCIDNYYDQVNALSEMITFSSRADVIWEVAVMVS